VVNTNDPRHNARRVAVAALFEWSFRPTTVEGSLLSVPVLIKAKTFQKGLAGNLIKGVEKNIEGIDKLIEKSATEWPLAQVAKIDLTILRLAIFELVFSKDRPPPKVVINEAIELGKEFGSETSGSFINGVLGNILENAK